MRDSKRPWQRSNRRLPFSRKRRPNGSATPPSTVVTWPDMRLAQNDRAAGHTERLFRLLEAQAPEPGRPDLRGWEWWQLFSECHSERFSFPSQCRPIAWSPDEKYLATVETSSERRTSV